MSKKNRMWTLAVAALAAAAVVAGCSGGGGDKPAAGGAGAFTGDLAKGKEVYAGTCAGCHGPEGGGIPGMGKSFTKPSEWMKKQTDEQLLAFIKAGRGAADPENTTKVDMPPKGGNPALSDDDIKNVITYMRSIAK